MSARGVSVLELLVSLTISALVVGAVASALLPARAAFETTPAALDLQQRSRLGLESVIAALRASGTFDRRGTASLVADSLVPAVIPNVATAVASGQAFTELTALSTTGLTARGVLDRDQPSAGATLTLSATIGCALLPDVCGFTAGSIAAISDGHGRFDIFEVAFADPVRMTLAPKVALSASYAAGSQVIEIDAPRFSAAAQAGGLKALVQSTAAGASQPIVDGVVSLTFTLWGEASAPVITWDGDFGWSSYGPPPPPAGWQDRGAAWPVGESCAIARDAAGLPHSRLARLGPPATLEIITRGMTQDGPWCAGGSAGEHYDADLLRVRRVDVTLRLEAMSPTLRGVAGPLFQRAGSNFQTPSHWLPDRTLTETVFVRNDR